MGDPASPGVLSRKKIARLNIVESSSCFLLFFSAADIFKEMSRGTKGAQFSLDEVSGWCSVFLLSYS